MMDDLGVSQTYHGVTRLTDLVAEFEVLGIHEIAFTKTSNLFEYTSTHHEARTGDRIDLDWLASRICECVRSPQFPRRKPAAQKIRIQHLIQNGGKRLDAAFLQSS